MTTKKAFIDSTEKAGINIQNYILTHDENYLNNAMVYIRSANELLKQLDSEKEDNS